MSAIKLYIPCPALDCPDVKKEKIYWHHAGCGGTTMINVQDITVFCLKCFKNGLVFDWNFRCKLHNFREGSLQGWLYAMTTMAQSETKPEVLTRSITKLYLEYVKRNGDDN